MALIRKQNQKQEHTQSLLSLGAPNPAGLPLQGMLGEIACVQCSYELFQPVCEVLFKLVLRALHLDSLQCEGLQINAGGSSLQLHAGICKEANVHFAAAILKQLKETLSISDVEAEGCEKILELASR